MNQHLFDSIDIAWRVAPKRAKDVRLRLWTAAPSRKDLKALKQGYGAVLSWLQRSFAELLPPDRERLAIQLRQLLHQLDEPPIRQALGGSDSGFVSRCCALILLGRTHYEALVANPARAARLHWTYLEGAELSVLCSLLKDPEGVMASADRPPPPQPDPPAARTVPAVPRLPARTLGPAVDKTQEAVRSLAETGQGLLHLQELLQRYQADHERLQQRLDGLQEGRFLLEPRVVQVEQRLTELAQRLPAPSVPAPAPPPVVPAEPWVPRLWAWSKTEEFQALTKAGTLTTMRCAQHLGVEPDIGRLRHIGRVLKQIGLLNIRVGSDPTVYRNKDGSP